MSKTHHASDSPGPTNTSRPHRYRHSPDGKPAIRTSEFPDARGTEQPSDADFRNLIWFPTRLRTSALTTDLRRELGSDHLTAARLQSAPGFRWLGGGGLQVRTPTMEDGILEALENRVRLILPSCRATPPLIPRRSRRSSGPTSRLGRHPATPSPPDPHRHQKRRVPRHRLDRTCASTT
jgi:hypothetical protein